MSIIEGGAFICGRHNFETSSIAEWNDHMDDGNHFEEGSTVCIKCGDPIKYNDLPYHPFDKAGSKNIQLRCNECEEKMIGKATIKKVGTAPGAGAEGAKKK